MPRLVVFDIGSSLGYFRKGFTTTSALTHAVIPRSTVEGLIGAILGLSSEEYPEKLGLSKIAIEITSPVRKLNMKYMHTNPDWWYNIVSPYLLSNRPSSRPMTQFAVPASVEFVVDPRYRLYFDSQRQDINNELLFKLENRQSHYTPYLGTSSMICFLKYIGEFDYNKMTTTANKKDYFPVSSIVPFSQKMPNIKLERESKFAIEDGLPVHVDNTRTPHGTYKVVYSPDANILQVVDSDLVEVQMGDKDKENNKKIKYVKFLPAKITS